MRKIPPQQPFDVGTPETTPFVRFNHGMALYPPNDIYSAAQTVIEGFNTTAAPDLFKVLIKRGRIYGQFGVLPESTWYSVLNNFLNYHIGGSSNKAATLDDCVRAIQIMNCRPCEDAWLELKNYLIEKIDSLSGWNSSSQFQITEEQQVVQGEDGNYYYHNHRGESVQIFGVKTNQETRLDFIVHQLVSHTGFLHQFLGLFSIFAITEDFERNRAHYYKLIKALLSESERGPIGCEWIFLHLDYPHSHKWRPYSNLCDPEWLAGDILGCLTDTLDMDFRHRNINASTQDQSWLDDGLKFQMDYALDTSLRIGAEPYAYIRFEGMVMRWINGTHEADATVSFGVASLQSHSTEDERLNRFLSLLVWEHGGHARIKFGGGGSRTAYSHVYSPRMAGGMRVDPGFLQREAILELTTDQKLALGVFREAQNSSSTFYEYLSYYKILELAVTNCKGVDSKAAREQWLNDVAIPKLCHDAGVRVKEIMKGHSSLECYLREIPANGIKHAIKKTVDTDKPGNQIATAKDIFLMKEIAKLVMQDKLGL